MPDLTSQILPQLQSYRIPNLELAEGCVHPNYPGYSILNLPASICHWLDIPAFGKQPLFQEALSAINQPVQRVIFILMDALGWPNFLKSLESGASPVWKNLLPSGMLTPLTSITPSTTSAALTSLWTGCSPAEHGIVGYELWLKEYGVVANMILHAPMSFRNDTGSLSRAGFQPERFLNLPLFGSHLKAHGIQPYAFQHASILRSGLSQMLMGQEVEARGFNTATDLWINLRELIQGRPNERQYIWVYWSEVDHYSHLYGPDDERPAVEFSLFSQAFESLLLNRLDARTRSGTLVILCADHGQITTRKTPHYDLRNHPNLARRLHLQPTGENRLMYLYIRPGQSEAVREYYERSWPRQFAWLDPAFAVQSGLFGPGKPHPQLFDRLGDRIVYGRKDAYLWWASKDNPLIGRHGGLSPEEMLVPFLAVSL